MSISTADSQQTGHRQALTGRQGTHLVEPPLPLQQADQALQAAALAGAPAAARRAGGATRGALARQGVGDPLQQRVGRVVDALFMARRRTEMLHKQRALKCMCPHCKHLRRRASGACLARARRTRPLRAAAAQCWPRGGARGAWPACRSGVGCGAGSAVPQLRWDRLGRMACRWGLPAGVGASLARSPSLATALLPLAAGRAEGAGRLAPRVLHAVLPLGQAVVCLPGRLLLPLLLSLMHPRLLLLLLQPPGARRGAGPRRSSPLAWLGRSLSCRPHTRPGRRRASAAAASAAAGPLLLQGAPELHSSPLRLSRRGGAHGRDGPPAGTGLARPPLPAGRLCQLLLGSGLQGRRAAISGRLERGVQLPNAGLKLWGRRALGRTCHQSQAGVTQLPNQLLPAPARGRRGGG